ncbi:MAG: calcium/sodium antiporter [bacterium]
MSFAVFWIVIFIISLYVLIRASAYFTNAAAKIGLAFGIPDFVVGLTIVAIGTSLPELISSIFAVLHNSSEIVIGNVVGSNITNIFLIVGVTAIAAKKLKITYELVHIDLPLLMGTALFLTITVWDGRFSLFEALLCLIGLVVYFLHAVTSGENGDWAKNRGMTRKPVKKIKVGVKTFIVLIISSFFIYLGGRYTVEAVIELSQIINIGKEIIAASVVAFGTSLPELAVSITAARQGKPEIAIGNVLGSNVFNALAVMGIPTLIGSLIIPQHIITFALPMMVIASLLFFFMTQDKEISQWEGWLLLIFYVFYIGGLFKIN